MFKVYHFKKIIWFESWKMFFLPSLFAKKAAFPGDLVKPLSGTCEGTSSLGPVPYALTLSPSCCLLWGSRLQLSCRSLFVVREPASPTCSLLPLNSNTNQACNCWTVQGIRIGGSGGLIKINIGELCWFTGTQLINTRGSHPSMWKCTRR